MELREVRELIGDYAIAKACVMHEHLDGVQPQTRRGYHGWHHGTWRAAGAATTAEPGEER